MAGPADFYLSRLQPLLGGEIVGLIRSGGDPEEEFFGLQIQDLKGAKWNLWFLQDPEGNGPGSFELTRQNKRRK